MHLRNEDAPYRSATDAMQYWPETATAVGVRLGPQDSIEVASPYGQADGTLQERQASVHMDRLRATDWGRIWPYLKIELLSEPQPG